MLLLLQLKSRSSYPPLSAWNPFLVGPLISNVSRLFHCCCIWFPSLLFMWHLSVPEMTSWLWWTLFFYIYCTPCVSYLPSLQEPEGKLTSSSDSAMNKRKTWSDIRHSRTYVWEQPDRRNYAWEVSLFLNLSLRTHFCRFAFEQLMFNPLVCSELCFSLSVKHFVNSVFRVGLYKESLLLFRVMWGWIVSQDALGHQTDSLNTLPV